MNIFGISIDSCYAHVRLINVREISFSLLSDTDGPYQGSWSLPTMSRTPPRRPETCAGHRKSRHIIRYLWQTDTANTQITLDELHNIVWRLNPLTEASESLYQTRTLYFALLILSTEHLLEVMYKV